MFNSERDTIYKTLLLYALMASPALAESAETLAGYSDFRKPSTTIVDQPMSYVADWITKFPGEGSNATLSLDAGFADDGTLRVGITESELADDSVANIQKRFDLRQTDDWRWQLTAYGFRQKCRRGNTRDWQDKPCP